MLDPVDEAERLESRRLRSRAFDHGLFARTRASTYSVLRPSKGAPNSLLTSFGINPRKWLAWLAELSKLTSSVDIEKKHSRKAQKYIFAFPGRFSPTGVRNEQHCWWQGSSISTGCRVARSES